MTVVAQPNTARKLIWSLKPEEAWAGFVGPGAGLKPARLMLIPISAMLAIGGSNAIKRPAPAQEVLRMGGS